MSKFIGEILACLLVAFLIGLTIATASLIINAVGVQKFWTTVAIATVGLWLITKI